jgi:heterodisulfide reductase subunit A
VDFATDGMFVAGLAHYPKPVEESVAQALAASARAATLLSKLHRSALMRSRPSRISNIAMAVRSVLMSVHIMPSPWLKKPAGDAARKYIEVNKAQCKGCGLCQGTCPKRGVMSVQGFTMDQISAQIQAALAV